jgi:hypothetical protein
MHALQAVIIRWDASLAATREQFERVLAEAWNATAPMVADTRLDLVPLTRVWGAVERQLHLHTSRVSDAWSATSDALSAIDGLPVELTWREGSKRDATNRELALRHDQYYRTMMAQAAEHMRRFALLQDAAEHACSGCGHALARRSAVAQAQHVTCSGCGTTTMIEPGDAWRIFAASGARCLAEAAALEAYAQMIRTELRVDQHRDRKTVPLAELVEYEAAARAYWTLVFEAEAAYVPEQAVYVGAKIERHMHDVRHKLSQYSQWRGAATAARR